MSDESNAAQKAYWNGAAGETWVVAQERLDRLLAPLSDAAIARAGELTGRRVLDIGCGCGATTGQLAEQGAIAHGVDISEPMLAHARTRFGHMPDLAFSQADAASVRFEPEYDLLFSRFGVMFFEDPFMAFRNLRTALVDDGRVVFVCWQEAGKNEWLSLAGRAAQPFLPPPARPVAPPGRIRPPEPFAFAEPDYVEAILTEAGFRDVGFESLTPMLHLAEDVDSAMALQTRVGPLARVLAELEGEAREQAMAAAREAFAARLSDAGILLGAAAWLVTARAA